MRAIDAFSDGLPATPPPAFAVGTIATVGAGTPPAVTVTWNGATVPARCSRQVTPVVGHVALMARVGPQLLIVATY